MAGKKRTAPDPFEEMTWDDLDAWAGSTIVERGKSYQRNRHVQKLARTADGGLVAWVVGTEKYATRVDYQDGQLMSTCTCPYWSTCKHAVAVVLEYLEQRKKKADIPIAAAGDRRLRLLEEVGDEAWDDEGEFEDDEDEDEVDIPAVRPHRAPKSGDRATRAYLEQQTKDDLIDLTRQLADRFPAVRDALQQRRELSEGNVKQLVKSIRKEIRDLSAKPGWQNYWDGEGYTPDYSGVRDRLETLLERGHADEVVAVGKELLEAGIRQIESSNDEGETATEITMCLDVVFRALPRSSLAAVDKILWAVDAELSDDYDLCQGLDAFWNESSFPAEDWNAVAETLAQRLKKMGRGKGIDEFTRNFRRDRLSDWLIHALDSAGRRDEIIPLCEREAGETGSYIRLVHYLMEAERWAEAEQWIHKGVKATHEKWPGIAADLRSLLLKIREQEKDWSRVAAFKADDFFREPALDTFQELQAAAERADAWAAVRPAAMRYLETGELPWSKARAGKRQAHPDWPLPETELADESRRWQPPFPIIDTLIDIAIAEKRIDDALRWYDRRGEQPHGWGRGAPLDDKVAAAVADSHPDRAIDIWKQVAEDYVAQTGKGAYQTAAGYLRKVRQALKKARREKEWQAYLAGLRQAHARKLRFLEILDGLEGKRIIDR